MTDPENDHYEIDLLTPLGVEDTPLSSIVLNGKEGLLILEELHVLIEVLAEEGIFPPPNIFVTPQQVVSFFSEATSRDELEMEMFLRNKGLNWLLPFIPADQEKAR